MGHIAWHVSVSANGFAHGLVSVCVYVCVRPFAQALPKRLVQLGESRRCWAPIVRSAHLRESKRAFCKLTAKRKHLDTGRLWVSAGFPWTVGAAYLIMLFIGNRAGGVAFG